MYTLVAIIFLSENHWKMCNKLRAVLVRTVANNNNLQRSATQNNDSMRKPNVVNAMICTFTNSCPWSSVASFHCRQDGLSNLVHVAGCCCKTFYYVTCLWNVKFYFRPDFRHQTLKFLFWLRSWFVATTLWRCTQFLVKYWTERYGKADDFMLSINHQNGTTSVTLYTIKFQANYLIKYVCVQNVVRSISFRVRQLVGHTNPAGTSCAEHKSTRFKTSASISSMIWALAQWTRTVWTSSISNIDRFWVSNRCANVWISSKHKCQIDSSEREATISQPKNIFTESR